MSDSESEESPDITREQYDQLVGYATELLKRPDSIGSEVEAEVKVITLKMLPADLEDRDEIADDLVLQAVTDAANATGRGQEMDSPDW